MVVTRIFFFVRDLRLNCTGEEDLHCEKENGQRLSLQKDLPWQCLSMKLEQISAVGWSHENIPDTPPNYVDKQSNQTLDYIKDERDG
jgi:hypothetical protein